MTSRRTPRSRNRAESERRILAAARQRFTAVGFDRATVRDIAAEADLNPALVIQYFGSKAQLFAAAVDVRSDLERIAGGTPEQLAAQVVRYFFERWERNDPSDPLVALVHSSLSNAHVADAFRRLLVDDAITPVAAALGGTEDARLRATVAGAQMLGIALCRNVIKLDSLVELPLSAVVELATEGAVRVMTSSELAGSPGSTESKSATGE